MAFMYCLSPHSPSLLPTCPILNRTWPPPLINVCPCVSPLSPVFMLHEGCCFGLYYELWPLESEICWALTDSNIHGVCPVRYQVLPHRHLPGISAMLLIQPSFTSASSQWRAEFCRVSQAENLFLKCAETIYIYYYQLKLGLGPVICIYLLCRFHWPLSTL